MTAWKYIDKRQFTISAIRDYNLMKAIIKSAPEGVKGENEAANADHFKQKATAFGKTPFTWVKGPINSTDLVEKRYMDAVEYMEWFSPAWESLSEQDKKILSEFYMGENRRSGASVRLQHALNYSDRHLDRLRANALDELSNLLLGN